MRIPLGYGECRIVVFYGYDGDDYDRKEFYFNHISGSVVIPEAVAVKYESVNHKTIQRIQGYHLNFDLKLIDKDIGTGDQDNLTDFLAYFYDTVFIDGGGGAEIQGQKLYLDFYKGGPSTPGQDYSNYALGKLNVIAEVPQIENIDLNNTTGQYLKLKARSEVMLSVDDMQDFWATYRDTVGTWGTIQPPEEEEV